MKCLLKCIGNIYAEADMKKTFDVKRLTTLALLTTIALTIFVVESAIPTLVPIPGVKLGLANIVTLFVLKRYKFSDAAIVLALLKQRLAEIDTQKSTQRKNRGRMIRVALVGYTNVGKSTLMNLLAKSEVFAENKLFATLDTTVRKVIIENLPFLLSDTVGFIRKLPTDLVDSFKSTLDEVREADLLVHVVDISHPDFEEQIQVVEKTIADLGAGGKPSMIVFNKVDAYTYVEKAEDDLTPKTKENITLEELMHTWMAKLNDNCIFISAREKTNIDQFRDLLYKKVKELHVQKYPYNDFLYQTYDEE